MEAKLPNEFLIYILKSQCPNILTVRDSQYSVLFRIGFLGRSLERLLP